MEVFKPWMQKGCTTMQDIKEQESGILPAIDVISGHVIVGVLYFIGFGLFCLETVLSIWVLQQVYMYFRGSGKAAQMKREAARGVMRAGAGL